MEARTCTPPQAHSPQYLAVDGTGEEQYVQEGGVSELPQSADAPEGERLKVLVHTEAVAMESHVPVDRQELHSSSIVSLHRSLGSKSVGAEHQLRHLTEVVH